MKKLYEKPMVEIISFSTEENIAGDHEMGSTVSPFALALEEDEEQG